MHRQLITTVRRTAVRSANTINFKYSSLKLFGANSQLNHKPSIAKFENINSKRRFSSVPDIPDDTNLNILLQNAIATYSNNPLFGTRVGDKFEYMTYGEFGKAVQSFKNVLAHHHIGYNDKVAIISNNRVEWAVSAYATFALGAQIVPMYEAQQEKDWNFIVTDSDAKVVIVANDTVFDKVKDYRGKVGKVESVIVFDRPENDDSGYQYWMQKVKDEKPVPSHDVKASDLCTIIYTSGTTGKPKGVELAHRNITFQLQGIGELLSDHLTQHNSLAYLPWAHIYGMTNELHALIQTGSSMAIVPSREQIVECIGIVKPTVIMSVPVLFNRVYDGVMKNISTQSPTKQKIFQGALAVARRCNAALEMGKTPGFIDSMMYKLYDKIVFSKVRERLGGNLRYMSAGGAATSLPVLQFFEDIGIKIAEGYGLSETSPVVTASGLEWNVRRLGCVGVPLKGVDVRIIDPDENDLPADTDGEIIVAGDLVMVQYRNNPEANAEVFLQKDNKRFFRTGDMGRMVEGKFLKITGRIKEQFKLENGKYVVPAPLEDIFGRSMMIAQIFICGDHKACTAALVIPDMVEVAAWAAAQPEPLTHLITPADKLTADEISMPLFKHPEFKKMMSAELIECAKKMHVKGFETPKLWTAIAQPFTQDNQMITPKMSIRRVAVIAKYGDLIESLYQCDGDVNNEDSPGVKVVYPKYEGSE